VSVKSILGLIVASNINLQQVAATQSFQQTQATQEDNSELPIIPLKTAASSLKKELQINMNTIS
jgi:hypothetical protein